MAKVTAKDPGTVLKLFLDEYQLNPSKLGKEVDLSQSTIRQITLNKMKISIPIALRFAKFFGNTVKFWIDLQTNYSLIEAEGDKELSEIIKKISKAVKPAPASKAAKPASSKARSKAGAKKGAVKKDKAASGAKTSRPRAKKTT